MRMKTILFERQSELLVGKPPTEDSYKRRAAILLLSYLKYESRKPIAEQPQ